MDASSVGAGNSALYLQRAQAGLQAPLTAVKQQENAALAIAQVLTQGGQTAQQAVATADAAVKSGAVGQVLDISV
ncbi:hypothetical protein H261_07573 [Paramagnetospirillum caucaseum]|uniref:Motility protein n=1 Tax=Paramagnetospirillum caucaseum TaxID=1244869 RepID=M3ACX1_9PROT|nr:hypothetical protein [Paramagnetospirillum caucaseum]EME70608.1 hypothetical protein H261_07573 [Paramagnetospirillum caucaseum]